MAAWGRLRLAWAGRMSRQPAVLGESWIEVPEAIFVEYTGELPPGMSGKEVILKTLGTLGRNTVALERSVEYGGSAARLFDRYALYHRQHDRRVRRPKRHLRARWHRRRLAGGRSEQTAAELFRARYFRADEDAPFLARYRIDLSQLGAALGLPVSPPITSRRCVSTWACRCTASSSVPAPPPKKSWCWAACC